MPDINITEIDLSEGIKAKNLVVPPMNVEVILKNPPAELLKAIKDDKVIVQKMAGAAFDVLKKARDDFRGAIGDLDESYTKKPPENEKEAEERVQTLNATCKKIAQAQSGAASAAAEDEWDRQAKKNADLGTFKLVFGLKMALGTISVAASVITAALSMGTLAVTLIGGAKTVVGMASQIYNFVRDIDKTETDIIDTDAALAKTWTNDKLTAGKVGKELAAALGAPLVKSIGGLDTLLSEYSAKSAKKDQMGDELWKEAKKLMAGIEKAPARVSVEQQKTLDKLGKEVTSLLDQVGDLSKQSKSNELFYKTYTARLKTYEAMEGGKLGAAAANTKGMVLVAGIAATAKSVVDIALALA